MLSYANFRTSACRIVATTIAICLPVSAMASTPADDPAASADARLSTTNQIPAGGRDGPVVDSRDDAYAPLKTSGSGDAARSAAAGKPLSGGALSSPADDDFWFYRADVRLFGDDDGDGYYHGIDLLFDADTYFEFADVYAVAYLSFEGGPWNEYAVTDDFTLYGATSDDEFVIVTELSSGYPAGNYDLLVELYDAIDGVYLASIGPEDTSELAYLPVEDRNRDAPRVRGGGGSMDGSLLAAMLFLLGLRAVAAARRSGRVTGLLRSA